MGCAIFRQISPLRIALQHDTGYLPSNENSPVQRLANEHQKTSPVNNPMSAISAFVKFKRNGYKCYFCLSNEGLLLKPFTCNCDNFFGHYECFKEWIDNNRFKCNICNNKYYYHNEKNRYDYAFRRVLCMSSLNKSMEFALYRWECMQKISSMREDSLENIDVQNKAEKIEKLVAKIGSTQHGENERCTKL